MLSIFKSKKTKIIIILLFSITILVLFSSIVYSAFSSTMNVTGIAHSRVEADVRVTDFSLEETVNATSSYEEFGKDHISTSISFKENVYAIYIVEVTNYGTTDVGIYSIEGVPEGITYELIDYNIKDKLCDNTGKCNSFSKTTFNIKFTSTNKEVDFTLKFNFKVIHNIAYINFTGNYPTDVYDGETLSVDVSVDSPKYVYINSNKEIIYNYKDNKLTLNNIGSNISIVAADDFQNTYSYTGSYKSLTIPYDGLYRIELWGSGGHIHDRVYPETVGKGGYTSGYIYLTKGEQIHFYVGGNDKFNGRGPGEAAGGSATDVRLIAGNWDNFDSLKSRIMVAAGGGGGVYNEETYEGSSPGDAGGLVGYDANYNSKNLGYGYSGYGATQTSGGVPGKESSVYQLTSNSTGKFGKGGFENINTENYYPSSGGGSGYYGGGHGVHSGFTWPGAGGGSSFISGHNGCNAINELSTDSNIIHTSQSIHYSGYKFTDTIMIDGRGYKWTNKKESTISKMPTFDGTSTMTGNTNTGYAKIELIQIKGLYKIKYTNIEGNYQSTIYKGNDLIVNFENNKPYAVNVLVDGIPIDYTYEDGILTVKEVNNDLEIIGITQSTSFDFTGKIQSYAIPVSGTYKVEVWGASGGYGYDSTRSTGGGGYGGYSVGEIELEYNQKLYIAIGGEGKSNCQTTTCNGGYNGGSASSKWAGGDGTGLWTGGGGGATHVALSNKGELKNYSSNKTDVLIVAGGGGGADYYQWSKYDSHPDGVASGGSGGGFKGVNGTQTTTTNKNIAGTQESGYSFGTAGTTYTSDSVGGSGGGWYGGTSNVQHVSGAGGSGYIGNTRLTNKHMTCFNCETSTTESTKTNSTTCKSEIATSDCSKLGNGYAKITLLTVK